MFDTEAFLTAVAAKSSEGVMSHMPFIVNDTVAMCCLRAPGGQWKSHVWSDGEFLRLELGLPDSAVECCPQAAIAADGGVEMSLVSDWPFSFAIHRMSGVSFRDLAAGSVGPTAHAGFIHGSASASTTKAVTLTRTGPSSETTLLLELDGRAVRVRLLDMKQVLHVAPLRDGSFIASLYSRQSGEEAIIVAVAEGGVEVSLVTARSGDRVYKPHIYDGVLYYANKAGDGFEDRVIVATGEYDIVPQYAASWVEVVE